MIDVLEICLCNMQRFFKERKTDDVFLWKIVLNFAQNLACGYTLKPPQMDCGNTLEPPH